MEGSAPLDDAELAQLLDSDELSALRICRSRFPLQTGLVPPVVLQHSLYSIIHDRAALDREVVSPPVRMWPAQQQQGMRTPML